METIDIITLDDSSTSLDEAALIAFKQPLDGTVLIPGDEGYDVARRVWNGMIDRRPALIARCAGVDDVIASIRFAQAHHLPVAVRGGGHNVAGSAVCDGGLVIDLAPMHAVTVDPEARRVSVQAGATLGAVDQATQAFGLAVPLGVVTETGVAGLTLGGGLGWLRRKHGLSCDALRAVDVVTADGRLLHASETEHADLFWAVRGGGGNFGIVTRFEYELYALGPDVFMLTLIYPASEVPDVLRFMQRYMQQVPDEFSPIGVLGRVPPLDGVAEAYHGTPGLILVGPYAGPVDEGAWMLAPLRAFGTPIADLSGTMPFVEVQRFFDEDYPSGARYYWKSLNLYDLPEEAVARLVALNAEAPSAHSTIDLWFQGGAMGRVAAEETAFGSRAAPYLLGVEGNWQDPTTDEANIAWVRRCIDALQPYSDGGMYLNFPGFLEEGEGLLHASYGPNYERLVALKRTYDPANVFRTHQNIKPG